MPVKLRDVAERVGYSVGAVSKVLSNPNNTRFSKVARNRILAAADEMGYVRNCVASRLRGGQANLVAMVLPWNTTEFMDFAEYEVSKAGYQFMVEFTRQPTVEAEMEALKRVLGWGVAGIIWAPFNLNENYRKHLEKLPLGKTKLVLLHENPGDLSVRADFVRTDAVRGIENAVTHLKDNNYEKLVYLSVGRDNPLRLRRKGAFIDSCGQQGLPAQIFGVDVEPKQVQRRVEEILTDLSGRVGIISMTIWLAIDVLMAAKSLNICVPEDLGIIGIGDSIIGGHIQVSDITSPPLTVLREPQAEMAQVAVKLLLERLGSDQEENLEPKGVILEEKLLLRTSSGAM